MTRIFMTKLTVNYCTMQNFVLENHSDPDLFQSDMRLTPMQRMLAESGGDVSLAKYLQENAFASAKDYGILWLPEKVVPYTISKELGKLSVM